MQRFTVLQTFTCKELKSDYVKGLSYTCKDGPKYDTLRKLLPVWIKEGKVEIGGPAAEVSGGN